MRRERDAQREIVEDMRVTIARLEAENLVGGGRGVGQQSFSMPPPGSPESVELRRGNSDDEDRRHRRHRHPTAASRSSAAPSRSSRHTRDTTSTMASAVSSASSRADRTLHHQHVSPPRRRTPVVEPAQPPKRASDDVILSLTAAVRALAARDNVQPAAPSVKDPADVKREQIKQLLIPNYTRDNGTTFVSNLRRQLRLLQIDEDDPAICGQLIGKLMNRLTPDLQAACGADKVSQVLDFWKEPAKDSRAWPKLRER